MLLGFLILALVGLVAAMQRPHAPAIAPVSAAFDHASTNWNASERTKEGVGFRWTGDESTLNFRAARRVLPANKPLILRMRFSGRPPDAPVTTITLFANGKQIDTWPSNVEHPVGIDVSSLLGRHDELHLTVRVADTYSPPRDKRLLGIALIGDARIEASPGKKLPSLDAVVSVEVLILLAAFAGGRRAGYRARLIAAAVMATLVTLGVLLARSLFWRIAMPLELSLAVLVLILWAREWWTGLTWPLRYLQERTRLDDRVLIPSGVVIALIGQVMVALHRSMFLGMVVLIAGLVVLLAGFIPTPHPPPDTEGGDGRTVHEPAAVAETDSPQPLAGSETRLAMWQIGVLVGIAALAVALRLTLLTEMPASLFKDEGRHALKAIRILDDPNYRPVYEPDIDLPALFLYPMALAFKLFGISLLTLRLFMALVGVADVLLLFFLSRRLFGTRVALIASYFFAVSFWALRMQRVALAPCFSTGLVLLGLLLFVRAVQLRRWGDWVLAGVGAAGTLYCYHSSPFTLVLIALVALIWLGRAPHRFFRYWLPRFAVLAAVFLVLAAPLLRYIALHFDAYAYRPRQTAIFSEVNLRRLGQDKLAAVQANIAPNLGMYTVQGDYEGKHNLPFAPHLDAILALFFLAGLALVIAGRCHGPPYTARRFGEWLALGYLAVMLVPSLLAIDAPNTLRAFDTLPPALLIAALGAEAIWTRLFRNNPLARASGSPVWWERGAIPVAALTLAAIFALNAGTYFGLMRHDSRETFRFDTYFATQVGKQMVAEAQTHPGTVFYVPRETIDRDVLPFFVRMMAGQGTLLPLDGVIAAGLPARYAILLPNGKFDTPPGDVIAALPWAKGLERVSGNSPAGANGVPAFIEYTSDER